MQCPQRQTRDVAVAAGKSGELRPNGRDFKRDPAGGVCLLWCPSGKRQMLGCCWPALMVGCGTWGTAHLVARVWRGSREKEVCQALMLCLVKVVDTLVSTVRRVLWRTLNTPKHGKCDSEMRFESDWHGRRALLKPGPCASRRVSPPSKPVGRRLHQLEAPSHKVSPGQTLPR